jgi:hypothetical protein
MVLKNQYQPLEFDKNKPKEVFEFKLSWEDVLFIANQLIDVINEIKSKKPGFEIYSGTIGVDISEKTAQYEQITNNLIKEKGIKLD